MDNVIHPVILVLAAIILVICLFIITNSIYNIIKLQILINENFKEIERLKKIRKKYGHDWRRNE